MKSGRADRRGLLLALALFAVILVLLLLAAVPREWVRQAKPSGSQPLQLHLIEPEAMADPRTAKGMSVGAEGLGTVLYAPARQYDPSPDPPDQLAEGRGAGVAAEVAGRIRLLASVVPPPPSDELMITTLEQSPPNFATVILRNGCLRLKQAGEPHVVFAPGTYIYVDHAGYLTIGHPATPTALHARVGELLWWDGSSTLAADEGAAARLRQRCGPGDLKLLGITSSVSASQSAADGVAAANYDRMYGVGWNAALAYVQKCRERIERSLPTSQPMIGTMCGNTPPSPVARQEDCPAGTSLSGGLCRTPNGHVRPAPSL